MHASLLILCTCTVCTCGITVYPYLVYICIMTEVLLTDTCPWQYASMAMASQWSAIFQFIHSVWNSDHSRIFPVIVLCNVLRKPKFQYTVKEEPLLSTTWIQRPPVYRDHRYYRLAHRPCTVKPVYCDHVRDQVLGGLCRQLSLYRGALLSLRSSLQWSM